MSCETYSNNLFYLQLFTLCMYLSFFLYAPHSISKEVLYSPLCFAHFITLCLYAKLAGKIIHNYANVKVHPAFCTCTIHDKVELPKHVITDFKKKRKNTSKYYHCVL